jgi:hypothetical protein
MGMTGKVPTYQDIELILYESKHFINVCFLTFNYQDTSLLAIRTYQV